MREEGRWYLVWFAAFAGPAFGAPFGYLLWAVMALVSSGGMLGGPLTFLVFSPLFVVLGYLNGFVPALIAGVILALLPAHRRYPWAGPVVGAAVAALWPFYVFWSGPVHFGDPVWLILIACAGAFAGFFVVHFHRASFKEDYAQPIAPE